ncbi:MAG: hypothetical protein AMJ69_08685 [Gammaproteobacteria bacterium SG8_47]|nr:MAG: hypothetical protein AMJ69_08685 [Gammaproteobacteria bacterium SG8_47]
MYPSTVKLAFGVFVLSLVLIVVSDVLNVARSATVLSTPLLITAIVLGGGLYATLGYLMFRRKNWARIIWTALYLAGMALVIVTDGGAHGQDVTVQAFGWLQALTQGIIACLIFLPSANRWFSQ